MKPTLLALSAALSLLAVWLAVIALRAMPVLTSAGDNRLRMLVSGSGSPSVVLETFGPASLETWSRIQPEISKFARVVSYDHGGYWGSEPGPKPRDARQIARELQTALLNAHVPPPYILVGYSFGGPYIRVFANLYPDEVCGMVFVDPAQEEFMEWLNRHFPNMNVVTEADRERQDEWGCQVASLRQAHDARLPNVPITLISAARPGGILLRRLLPEWVEAHRTWLTHFKGAQHIITTNSGHGIFFSEPNLVAQAVREMADRVSSVSKAGELQSLAGEYRAAPDTIIHVGASHGYLLLQVGSGESMNFIPEIADALVHRDSNTRLKFARNAHGVVTDLILLRNGEHRAARISSAVYAGDVQTVTLGTQTYRHLTSGAGRPVVLLGNIERWTMVQRALEPVARVVSLERLEGEPNAVPATVGQQAAELHDALTLIGMNSPFILVGQSYGGALARVFAKSYPNSVAALALIDPLHEDFADWLETNQPHNYELFKQECIGRYASDWDGLLRELRAAPPLLFPVTVLTAGQREIRAGDALEQKLKQKEFEQGAKAVLEAHRKWVCFQPAGTHMLIEGAGHEIHVERPQRVAQAIEELLRRTADQPVKEKRR